MGLGIAYQLELPVATLVTSPSSEFTNSERALGLPFQLVTDMVACRLGETLGRAFGAPDDACGNRQGFS